MGSDGWLNEGTKKVWMHISNDQEIMEVINESVRHIYLRHRNMAAFSRRGLATKAVGSMVQGYVSDLLREMPWYFAMCPWAKGLLEYTLQEVAWNEIAEVLIDDHEYTHNQVTTL